MLLFAIFAMGLSVEDAVDDAEAAVPNWAAAALSTDLSAQTIWGGRRRAIVQMSRLSNKCTPETDWMVNWIQKTGDNIYAAGTSSVGTAVKLLKVNTANPSSPTIKSDAVDHEARFLKTPSGKSCRITRSMGTGSFKVNNGNTMKVTYVKMGVCKPRPARADGKTPCNDPAITMVSINVPLINAAINNAASTSGGGRRLLEARRWTRRRRYTSGCASRRRTGGSCATRRRRDPTPAPTATPTAAPTPPPDVMCCATKRWIADCNVAMADGTQKKCKDVTELPPEALNTVAASFI